MDSGSIIVVLLCVIVLYFIPSFVAAGRQRNGGVIVLNLFLGWTLIGWVAALAWAASLEQKSTPPKPELPPQLIACPFCAEEIKPEAIVCKHCGRDLLEK